MKKNASWLINCYLNGVFPMSNGLFGDIDIYSPDPRAILPLENIHVSKSLRKTIRQKKFFLTIDKSTELVMKKCRRELENPNEIWLSDELFDIYLELTKLNLLHSFEAWKGTDLAGGLFGVSIGGVFYAESMFHEPNFGTNASKVILVLAAKALKLSGFKIFDIQFMTSHLKTFGALEITREEFHQNLEKALKINCLFPKSMEQALEEFTS